MSYTFVRIKVHPKLDLTGWYLAIQSSDIDLQMNMHKSATWAMFKRFFQNPHVFDQKTLLPKYAGAEHYHPVKLATGWIQSALKGLAAHGVIYMNCAHGLLFGDSVEILDTRESEKLEFPQSDNKDDVRITISMWPCGQHFYLFANNNQVFSQPKFDSQAEAMEEALIYAHKRNISFKVGDPLSVYTHEGD